METKHTIWQVICALEGDAANTSDDPRWLAATALRKSSDLERIIYIDDVK